MYQVPLLSCLLSYREQDSNGIYSHCSGGGVCKVTGTNRDTGGGDGGCVLEQDCHWEPIGNNGY